MAAKLGAYEIFQNIIQLGLEKQNNNTSVSKNTHMSPKFEFIGFIRIVFIRLHHLGA